MAFHPPTKKPGEQPGAQPPWLLHFSPSALGWDPQTQEQGDNKVRNLPVAYHLLCSWPGKDGADTKKRTGP